MNLSRSNFARSGSPDPGQKRGFGNPLGAILGLLKVQELTDDPELLAWTEQALAQIDDAD